MADVTMFASYAHVDNESLYGRIRTICVDIPRTFLSLAGLEAELFFDADSIPLGERWRDRIDSGLASSTILFAFVSPAYLRSGPCREEFRSFLSFLGPERSRRLVIPLLLTPVEVIDRRYADDELWVEIKELQYLPISDLRTADPGSRVWMEKIHVIADRIDEIVTLNQDEPDVVSVDVDTSVGDGEERGGVYERLALMESELPEMNEVVQEFAVTLDRYNEIATDATPRLQAATSFGQRLSIANRMANDFDAVADEGLRLASRLRHQLVAIDVGMMEAIRMASALSDQELADPGIRKFVESVDLFARNGVSAAVSLEGFKDSIEVVRGFSGPLDRVFKKMVNSVLVMIDAKAIFQTWSDELQHVKGRLGN